MEKFMSILFVNACVRDNSRTLVLAAEIMKDITDEIVEISLNDEKIPALDRDALAKRESLVREGRLDDEMLRYARQFAKADEIFIAAPYWDLSFPALLKAYLEQITVAGITFEYQNCRPVGLCRAKQLTYITTSGGPIFADFGYEYVKTLAKSFYGIPQTKVYRAMNLDVNMISADRLLTDAEITTGE